VDDEDVELEPDDRADEYKEDEGEERDVDEHEDDDDGKEQGVASEVSAAGAVRSRSCSEAWC
jgi:hypothetical protein